MVWAVKPQTFKEAALSVGPLTRTALHLSVAAGIPSDSIARWLGNAQVVRSMPNTPALIGKGITALYARAGVNAQQKQAIEQIIRSTGELLWVDNEDQLDAVTALSGSGPAYVFFFLEAYDRGRPADGPEPGAVLPAGRRDVRRRVGVGRQLRSSTAGAASTRHLQGGTTHAAITSMQASHIGELFQQAMLAARDRAREMGREFGAT